MLQHEMTDEEIAKRAEEGYREYCAQHKKKGVVRHKAEDTDRMKKVIHKAINTMPWKDVPQVERTLERWREEVAARSNDAEGMSVKFGEKKVDWSKEYDKEVQEGVGLAIADQMKKNKETLAQGLPLYLLVKLQKGHSSWIGDDWEMKVMQANNEAWDLVRDRDLAKTGNILYQLRGLNAEDLATVIEQLGDNLSRDMMKRIAEVWNLDVAKKRKGKMMKLFEVFIVRKESKEVSRSLAWGKDPQAIREKALLDAGITSEDYEASQVVVKFVAEFDFPAEGEVE